MDRARPRVDIYGSGPAGSAAARQRANQGRSVALLEQASEAGKSTVCGGMVSLSMVKRFDVYPDGVEKVMQSERHILPWTIMENTTAQCTVRRSTFDRMLAQRAADAGAELMTSTRARVVRVRKPGLVEVEAERRSSVRSISLGARGLILADGPRTLAQSLGLGYRLSDACAAFALAYELSWPGNEMDHYELYYGGQIARWGYAWVFPYRDVLNVGMGCIGAELRKRQNLRYDLLEFIRHHPYASKMLADKAIVHKRGGWIALCPARRMAGPSTLVVGDAAGWVRPLIASGLDNALVSGELAAQVMEEALTAGDLSLGFLMRYQREWQGMAVSRFMRVQGCLARVGQPLSYLDRNILAKTIQLALLGGKLTWPGKIQALGYPWLGIPTRMRVS